MKKITFYQTLTPAVFHIVLLFHHLNFDFGVFCQLTRWHKQSQGPPVQTSVCCGESALSSASTHEKYHKRRLQFMLLQEDEEELIQSSSVTRHTVDKCHASHLAAPD